MKPGTPIPCVFDGSRLSCFSLVFQVHDDALLITVAIIKIAESQALKIGIDLRFGDTGMVCIG